LSPRQGVAVKYTKPALTFEQQLDQLIDRGLAVPDRQVALHALQRISYYRLSGYWLPFKRQGDTFEAGASFDVALSLYEFDRRLRLLVMDAIERAEVAVRTAVTYELAHRYGAFGHTDARNFCPDFKHGDCIASAKAEAARAREKFIKHYKVKYKVKYDGFPTLPIWMATEVISLGGLSRLYSGMKKGDQKPIAGAYGVHPPVLGSWLHTLTYVRNVCAHHSRLWNRVLGVAPKLPRNEPNWFPPHVPHNDRLWVVLLILRRLMNHHHQGGDWQADIERLVEPFVVDGRWRAAMGFPDAWREHAVWCPT